jgi:hypothetical protein
MATQSPTQMLENISTLLALYIVSGNRQVLTQIRRAVSTLLRDNPPIIFRLEETFDAHQLSMDIL